MRPFSSFDLRVLYLCGVFHVCHVTIDSRDGLVVLVTLFHSAEVHADGGVGIFVGLRSRAHLGFKLRVLCTQDLSRPLVQIRFITFNSDQLNPALR